MCYSRLCVAGRPIDGSGEGVAEAVLVSVANVDTAFLGNDPTRGFEVGGSPHRHIPIKFEVELNDEVDTMA